MKPISLCFALLVLLETTASAAPILPPSISVGTTVTGSLSYNVTVTPLDEIGDPHLGQYRFSDHASGGTLTAGGFTFGTQVASPNVLLRTTDSDSGLVGGADFIQISTVGDESTFAFLDFSGQNAAGPSYGSILVNMRFPFTALNSDAIPTSIDPSTTQPHPGDLFTTGIYGQVEGVSRQTAQDSTREWVFFFEANPNDVVAINSGLTLTVAFTGTVVKVERGLDTPTSSIPEPASSLVLAAGLSAAARARRLSRRPKR